MKALKRFLIISIVFIVSSAILFVAAWAYFAPMLEMEKITEINQTTEIFDKDDKFITGVYSEQNRTKIKSSQLPSHVKNAFIAIEDERFYSHHGVDLKRICGAAVSNIKSGGINEGASTISQQLIKLSHLSSEKTFSRKIKEAFLALELERTHSKDEILEMYLNYCYFGGGAYGIEAGARRYFGVSAKDLSLSQSALLAGVLKSPSKFAPHRNLEKSIERRNLVLKQMYECGYISAAEFESAKAEKPVLVENNDETYPYGYYVDTVLYEAEQITGKDAEDLQKEGYKIYTNLDTSVQTALEEATAQELPASQDGEELQAAMVVLSTKGEITAITGGRNHTARRGINRAMDNKRSPGSAIKPVLVYAPAYEQQGYTNATLLLDEKQNFNEYSPSNSSDKYNGWVTVKKALAQSLNVPAVKTLNTVGVEKAKDYAKSVGIEFEPEDNHLALALGGFSKGVTPLQLAAAYVPFSNGGSYYKPAAIRKIEDRTGKVIYQSEQEGNRVLSEENAFLLTNLLCEVVISGTGKRLQELNMPVAAKTGTSNVQGTGKNKDAWLVGYTTDYICTAWIGLDSGNPLPEGISGGTYPADMVKTFFTKVYKTQKPEDFPVPSGIVEAELDKTALEKNNKIVLANRLAPNSKKLKEYFTKETAPTEYAYFDKVEKPKNGFNLSLSENGYPFISFDTGETSINYTVMRIGEDGQSPVYQTEGQNKTVTFEDKTAEQGKTHKYYIVTMQNGETTESKKLEITVGNKKEIPKTNDTVPTDDTQDYGQFDD